MYAQVPFPTVYYNGTYPTWSGCAAACMSANAAGQPVAPGCQAWTWHDQAQAGYELHCYFRTDTTYSLHPETGHVSGRLAPPMNVWRTSLSGILGVGTVPGLRVGRDRAIRARYPNANPETDHFMPPTVRGVGNDCRRRPCPGYLLGKLLPHQLFLIAAHLVRRCFARTGRRSSCRVRPRSRLR